MWGGSEARARVPIWWRRSPARTDPLWSSTGIPSTVSHASLSRPVAPRRKARRNAATVCLHKPTAHVEPDPGAAVGAGGGAVELEEALEESGNVAGEDAGASVHHRHLDLLAAVGDLHRDLAVGVLESVVEQMADDL